MGATARSILRVVRNSGNAIYTMYPITGGPPSTGQTAGVALPHDNNIAAGAWGAWTQILLAAAAPAVQYWYCGYKIILSAAAGQQQHSVQIGTGLVAGPPAPIHDGVDSPDRAAAAAGDTAFEWNKPDYPIYEPAATPISGRSAVTAKAAATKITTAVLLATGL